MKRVLIAFCIWFVLMLLTVTLISQPVVELGVDAPLPSFKVGPKASVVGRFNDLELAASATWFVNYSVGMSATAAYRLPSSYVQGDWGHGFLFVLGAGYSALNQKAKDNGGVNKWHPTIGIKQCISGNTNTYWSLLYQYDMVCLGVGFRFGD